MRPFFISSALLLCIAWLTSCREGAGGEKASSGPPVAGALYSLGDGEGGYRVGKILAVEEGEVVFINLFANRWTSRPSRSDARKAGTPVPIAYSFQTFTGMQPTMLDNGNVTAEELESYEHWKQGKRETF